MKCPLCAADLVMSERQGIEIDYCPQCRGVWLDRGELDKIIERANASASSVAPARATVPVSFASAPSYDERRYDDYKKHPKKKKRGDFLSELFEFGE